MNGVSWDLARIGELAADLTRLRAGMRLRRSLVPGEFR